MLDKEAIWIGRNLTILSLNPDSVVLNFGSQNQKYNHENKCMMDYVINPIRQRCHLRNLDLQWGDGIDYSGDLYEDKFFNKIKEFQFDCVLLCNVLEHVSNVTELTRRVAELIKPGGYIIFTGPYEYPIHYDPIDNGFRPTVDEVLCLFNSCQKILGEIIEDFAYSYYMAKSLKNFSMMILRVVMPFYKFKKWQHIVLPKFKWWNRKYKVTCVLMRKEG